MSWQLNPDYFKYFLTKEALTRMLENPLGFLYDVVGQALFFGVVYLVAVFAGWRHTKSLLGAGVVSLMFTPLAVVPGELQYLGFLAGGFGVAAIVYELARKMV